MRNNAGFKRISLSLLMLAGSCMAATAIAGNYGVQVGVYKNVPAGLVDQLESYATVTIVPRKSLTGVIVGSYGSVGEAQDTLEQLRNVGFSDAFVKDIDRAFAQAERSTYSAKVAETQYDHHAIGHSESHKGGTSKAAHGHSHPHLSSSESAKWDSLTPSQQANAVLLDGKLHLKEGDRFTPINVSVK